MDTIVFDRVEEGSEGLVGGWVSEMVPGSPAIPEVAAYENPTGPEYPDLDPLALIKKKATLL